jgi:hypothetical protein
LLSKVQCLACLGITGAMSSCPTAAMEAIIGLTPLHIFVKKIAATSALKLQRKLHNQHMVLSLTGHLEILRELGDLDKYIYVSDFTPKHYCFQGRT